MVDWHNPEHVLRPTRRVALLVSAGRSLATIAAEIAVCTPLCRKCHMAEDGRLKGLMPPPAPGERNPNAKLTRDQVLAIRKRIADLRARAVERGTKHIARGALSALAAEFGVSISRISQIARREAWAWLGEDAA
jgi:hypothetical protein